jgi:probable F420-dependent oxidoreductase
LDTGTLGVWYYFDLLTSRQAADAAKRIEDLGYGTLWIPESMGRNPFAHAAWLLANTTRLNVATGIASIYNREPGVALSGQNTLAEQSDDRFLLGLGVSHQPFVEGVRKREYGPPLASMRQYLQAMDASPYMATAPAIKPRRVIAALGPKMLALARDACDGAHPYSVTPAHTATARAILGPDKWLCVEQKVIVETDPVIARGVARAAIQRHLALPNYRNSWLTMGMDEADFNDGGSDRFIDAIFAWGSAATVKARISEHMRAGASHVCLHPVNPNGKLGDPDWAALTSLAG